MATTLQNIWREVWDLLDPQESEILRISDLTTYINDTYRDVVKAGQLLEDSALSTTIDDQERYDLTAAIWLPDSGLTDSTAVINEGAEFSATDTTLTVDDGTQFAANQLIKIDDEVLRITAIATHNLTVVRGQAGTTAAAHDDGILELQRVDYDGYKRDIYPKDEIEDLDVT
jgi:hypothetical protein